MTAYVYTWDVMAQKWALNDVLDTEGAAKEKGRALWRAGAAGVKIDAIRTVVEEKRTA